MTQRQTIGRVEGKVALVTGTESSTTPDGRDGRQAPDPQGRSYASWASFNDPDGNGWLLQEITTRLPGR